MSKKVLITCALPYANGLLHFGHIAGAYLPGDCYARYERLKGNDVLFLCGSDEYGIAITLSADLAKRSPKEHVDIFHKGIQDLFAQLNFSFDHYSRTSWPGHVQTTQEYFRDLYDNGYIEEKITAQLYSEQDGKFLADRYVVGTCPKCGYTEARGDECQKCGASYEATDLREPRSKLTRAPLVLKETKHWFLRFDRFKDQLSAWLAQKHWKPNVLNFAKGYVEEVKPRAITRDMTWGVPIPLPDTQGKVLYVWFDAPIGYISAAREWAEQQHAPDKWKDYWCDPDTKLVQFIGKDNIPFHAVFFPAMTMGQNQPYKLVDELPANEFYLLEGKQFSKSDGWFIDLEAFFKKFTAEQIRYVIAANAPETQDSEFTWKDFQARCNHELLGKYGNFVNRTLVFAQNHCGGKVPVLQGLSAQDQEFLRQIQKLVGDADEAYGHFRLRRAAAVVMELAQLGNVYFDAKKPWVAAKDPKTYDDMNNTIGCCMQCLAALALISSPILPESAERIWRMLGHKERLEKNKWEAVVQAPLHSGTVLPAPQILFTKVEDPMIQEEIDKLGAKKEIQGPTAKELIGIDEMRKVDLRVGKILTVERVPKSKKLLKFAVDLNEGAPRTILSGIGDKIADLEPLVGKKIIIVANLKPVVMMGIESQGMLLSVLLENGYEMPSVLEALPGSEVL